MANAWFEICRCSKLAMMSHLVTGTTCDCGMSLRYDDVAASETIGSVWVSHQPGPRKGQAFMVMKAEWGQPTAIQYESESGVVQVTRDWWVAALPEPMGMGKAKSRERYRFECSCGFGSDEPGIEGKHSCNARPLPRIGQVWQDTAGFAHEVESIVDGVKVRFKDRVPWAHVSDMLRCWKQVAPYDDDGKPVAQQPVGELIARPGDWCGKLEEVLS